MFASIAPIQKCSFANYVEVTEPLPSTLTHFNGCTVTRMSARPPLFYPFTAHCPCIAISRVNWATGGNGQAGTHVVTPLPSPSCRARTAWQWRSGPWMPQSPRGTALVQSVSLALRRRCRRHTSRPWGRPSCPCGRRGRTWPCTSG